MLKTMLITHILLQLPQWTWAVNRQFENECTLIEDSGERLIPISQSRRGPEGIISLFDSCSLAFSSQIMQKLSFSWASEAFPYVAWDSTPDQVTGSSGWSLFHMRPWFDLFTTKVGAGQADIATTDCRALQPFGRHAHRRWAYGRSLIGTDFVL